MESQNKNDSQLMTGEWLGAHGHRHLGLGLYRPASGSKTIFSCPRYGHLMDHLNSNNTLGEWSSFIMLLEKSALPMKGVFHLPVKS